MDKTGHTFVYSLSPGFAGDSPLVETALKVTSPLVNMYRMTLDWHGWHGQDDEPGWPNHFELAGAYSAYQGSVGAHGKSWPDLDMLNPFKDRCEERLLGAIFMLKHSFTKTGSGQT
jgi:hypothetical protein